MNTTQKIERLMDVEMDVTVRFGVTELPLREIVHLGLGSMIELDRTVDEPVELLVNNYPFARGEVVVIDGYYGVRVTEIGTAEERSQTILSHSNEDADVFAAMAEPFAARDEAPDAAASEAAGDEAADEAPEAAGEIEDSEVTE